MKPQSIRLLRSQLRALSLQSPELPNHGSRFAVTLHQQLREGKRCRSAAWVCQVFDRASPWILPRYTKGFVGSLSEVTERATAYLTASIPASQAVAEKVNAAIVAVRPFNALTT